MFKTCFKCNKRKPIDEFYKLERMADGHLNKCKTCTKKDVSNRYRSPEGRKKVRKYDAMRQQTEHRRRQRRIYQRNRRKNNPGVFRANNAVNNALRDGRITKLPCEVCGNKRSQAHHDDYRSPLKVRWLCFKHHREIHGQIVG